jgi:hypothetical protein
VVLRRKNTSTRHRAEHAEIENEHKLVRYGNTVHLNRADLTHHYVVKQRNKIGDTVLYHNGKRHRQDPTVKGPIPEKLL